MAATNVCTPYHAWLGNRGIVLKLSEFLSGHANSKGVSTKHPDYVLRCTDTSIKVTILALIYAVYPWSYHCESTVMEKVAFW